ncbi:50S ribosomal protein L19 [Helicobacter sp. MIT 99-5507]|uniref:50S ribosomal protein L19 n=1 Tax=Helicobacter sp. MIT 99-5507 TaxID=152489 RepID=UPI000E1E5C18|nr:50S ribosomal protein L19 [Helicobacter sp. MIT 99-5507]RDU57438.1 50S ribosomal protein L19 [Helicobacter sp. MIT 99-5507]
MQNRYIDMFEQSQIKDKQIPQFKAGDTIKIGITIKEGDKIRIQYFEGICISIRGHGLNRSFTIRKIGANNVGVEKIFPIYSESLASIEVVRIGRVRRAKLYYLRDKKGKSARIKELRKQDIKK